MNQKNKIDYDVREQDIINALKKGLSRIELAKQYNYASWRSLDIFMRRRNYVYHNGNYISANEYQAQQNEPLTTGSSIKAQQIAYEFANPDTAKDPISIAKKYGFSDHLAMNTYLKSNGYIYNSTTKTYETAQHNSSHAITTPQSHSPQCSDTVPQKASISPNAAPLKNNLPSSENELASFLPLLNFLADNQENLQTLLACQKEQQVPRYLVPGACKAKSVYMSSLLANLLNDFANSKNISIKEICEGALIEYLKKYGYHEEVSILLNKN